MSEPTSVPIARITIPDDRVRTESGEDIEELAASIKKHGIIQPVVVDENMVLIAGYRRLMAAKNAGKKQVPVIVKAGLSQYEKLEIEIEENLNRADLTPYEMSVALARKKKIYEKLHPETVRGKYIREFGKKGKSRPKNTPGKKQDPGITAKMATMDEKKPKESFVKQEAKKRVLAERTISRKVRIGNAILKGKMDKTLEKQFKEGKVTEKRVLNELARKTPSKKRAKKPQPRLPLPDPPKKPKTCKECPKVKATMCPHCKKQVIICDKKSHYILKKPDSPACEDYDT